MRVHILALSQVTAYAFYINNFGTIYVILGYVSCFIGMEMYRLFWLFFSRPCHLYTRISLREIRITLQDTHSLVSVKLTREKENQKHKKERRTTETRRTKKQQA